MLIQDIVHFDDERFFEGAVQLSWLVKRPDHAQLAAESFVFHGPRYHGVSQSQKSIDNNYRLKDTASFVRDLLKSMVNVEQISSDETPFRMVVAGYGSGKSHLALTCASLLKAPSGDSAKLILEQLSRADGVIGEKVCSYLAALSKPVLVLPLDGMAGFHLGNALSQSIFKQLDLLNIDADPIRSLSPRFITARQFVERNFSFRKDIFNKLLPDVSESMICKGLLEHDEQIYEVVDNIFALANGQPIPVEGQESAKELIDTLARVYCGPDGPFSHVVIMFDEFGRYLEYAGDRPHLAGDAALQQMFEGIQDHQDKIKFVGFIQYELKAYLKRFHGAGLRQLQRYITRFDTAEKWYLSTNLETIFANMIRKQESALDLLWQKSGVKNQYEKTHARIAATLPSFARYPVWQEADRFSEVIGRGCWPLHPLTVWFLTKQKDVVQSRSALTFIKDMLTQFGTMQVMDKQHLKQISVADLILNSGMLDELIASEKDVGGSIAETLQSLLSKLGAHLTTNQQLVLAGCAALEKMRIGKQSQATTNIMLYEATALSELQVTETLESLSEIGALEWNRDLGQYELLTDGASRGQFQQWMRKQQHGFDRSAGRNLFMRWASRGEYLPGITTDFAQSKNIATPEWRFEPSCAHSGILTNGIQQAFKDWSDAKQPNEAKGRILYLYLDSEDSIEKVEQQIQSDFACELNRYEVAQAPIWIIAVHDHSAAVMEHLTKLHILHEQISDSDIERFRRFIPEEIYRSETALKQSLEILLRERQFWVAGFKQVPDGRLKKAADEIFQTVYPHTTPFPVDGFATMSGTAKADCAQLMRGLIARQVDGNWVQAQRRSLHNRVHNLMAQSWRTMTANGKLVAPQNDAVKAVFDMLVLAHQADMERTFYQSYVQLLRPPYGMNSASAGLLISLLIALDIPPRRLVYNGSLIASSDWVGVAFTSKGNELQETVLRNTALRFLAEDSSARWRNLLENWDLTKFYADILDYENQARQMQRIDAIPESLEGTLKYLRDKSSKVRERLDGCNADLTEFEASLARAESRSDLVLALRVTKKLFQLKVELESSGFWPAKLVEEASKLLNIGKELVQNHIGQWIPRQHCTSMATLSDFRSKMESNINALVLLGYERYAAALQAQVSSSITRIEQLQQYGESLALCKDYPRQPSPAAATTVQELRDAVSQGEQLILMLQQASKTLTQQEIDSHVAAIRERQTQLKEDLQKKLNFMSELYNAPHSLQDIQELEQEAKRLQKIFIGTKDDEDISEIIYVTEYIQRDISSWPFKDVSATRLSEILNAQSAKQAQACIFHLESKDIEPAWCIESVYKEIALERIKIIEHQSHEWVAPRLILRGQLDQMELQDCVTAKEELARAPIYLSDSDRDEVTNIVKLINSRIQFLQEKLYRRRNAAWLETFTEIGDIGDLDSYETETHLKRIKEPPHELAIQEMEIIDPIEKALLSHFDKLSIDGILFRISKLPYDKQLEIIKRVEENIESTVVKS